MIKINNLEGRVKYATRHKLNILLSEYCTLDMIYQLQGNPKSKFIGWCYASNDYYATHLGMSTRGIQKIKKRMVDVGLAEKHLKFDQCIRTTSIFYDVHILGYEVKFEDGKYVTFEGRTQFTPPMNSVHPICLVIYLV